MLFLFTPKPAAQSNWPLWTHYVKHFIQQDGRVIDPDRENLTTSEGQSYAMFFALVANDSTTFERSYQWTVQNLADGNLEQNLPAWSWGYKPDGTFGVTDTNSASDADMWIAYDLLQAGRLWKRRDYTTAGESLLKLIAAKEVSHSFSFPVLLPAHTGFEHDDATILNTSYMPLFLFQAAAKAQPAGPWSAMAATLPSLVRGATTRGFATDWLKIDTDGIMTPAPPLNSDTEEAAGSYDAIRVYLWAGLTASATPGRNAILNDLSGMTAYLKSHALPPESVTESQPSIHGTGPISFSAALIPFLQASQAFDAVTQQQKRLNAAWSSRSGLYGEPARYYDQNLAMFALGYTEHRYRMQNNGDLEVSWQK
jgi:endoglucanase